MSYSNLECSVYILTKDGTKSCNIFRFENQGIFLVRYDAEDLKRRFSGVANGKMFLDQLDGLYQGFIWDNHARGYDSDYNRWWKEEAVSIERICALQDFQSIERIVIEETLGLSDGYYSGTHFTLNFPSDNKISSLNSRLESVTTVQWRKIFAIDFQFYSRNPGDNEGFEKFAAIGGYKGNHPEIIVPRYLNKHKIIGLKTNFLKNSETATSVIVPEGYWDISSSCFNNCPNLEKIYLPATLVQLQPDAIKKCPKARFVVVAGSKAETLAKQKNLPYEVVPQDYNYLESMSAFLDAHGIR